jgi:hypothetical protein
MRKFKNSGGIKNFMYNWTKCNIFHFRKGDGIAYLAFYIVIPIIISMITLYTLSKNELSVIYCYMTILISALNSTYDGANRWDSGTKSLYNTKIFIVLLADFVVAIYCAFVIIFILINENSIWRCDYILSVYLIAVAIALFDIIGNFACDMALQEYINKK